MRVSVILLLCLPLFAQETGFSIMQKNKERHKLKQESEKVLMIQKDKQGRLKERKITIYAMEDENGLHKAMIKFSEPQDVRNVGLLTWEQKDKDDDQWLFLPSQKRAKRIAAGGKKNTFMGTDLAYEDMRSEDLESHSYQLTGSKTIEGQDCHVIEALPSTPQEKKESGYSKRIFYIRKDIMLPIRTEYFEGDKLAKVGLAKKVEKVKDEVWRVTELEMSDPKRGTSTTMKTESRSSEAIDPGVFTLRFLEQAAD